MPWHEQHENPPFVGELSVAENRDLELGRTTVRARLRAALTEGGADILPELTDAHLLWAADNKMRLTGFERVDKASYAQTWSVEVA